jgi:MoaA/NifB/PqqE/SkfB family radical SAM enzyme
MQPIARFQRLLDGWREILLEPDLPVDRLAAFLSNQADRLRPRESFPGSLDPDVMRAYNRSRNLSVNKRLVCHAPFKNMYFNVTGNVGACWLRFAGPESDPDRYPDKTIREIWFGDRYDRLREHIRRRDLGYKCNVCKDNLQHGNFVSLLAKAYDNRYRIRKYPVMMELELDNTCNLECIMCNGVLSSSIRVHREKKPRVHSPYDEAFVTQLEEFIPHLREARFNGGEPFLSDINFRVWERMLRKNPRIRIVVATNGTVLNERVKNLLNRGRFHINLSFDSLDKATYEAIRKNASFEDTMEHIRYFDRYCREKGTAFVVLLNPMRPNWREIPDFVRTFNRMNVALWFNTIFRPYHLSLWNLPPEELKKIHEELSRHDFPVTEGKGNHSHHNRSVYRSLVEQIRTWCEEPLETRHEVREEILHYDGQGG